MSSAVLPEHGPTLPELLTPRVPRSIQRALGALVVLAAIAIAVMIAIPGGSDRQLVGSVDGLEFNFIHDARLAAAPERPGEVLRLESEVNGRFAQSFSILPLELPEHTGLAGAVLPVVADAEIDALRGTRAEFELVGEGKARVVEAAGYSISYRARLGERRLYGRLVLLPSPEPGTRRGVKLLLEATPVAGVPRAEDVGARGLTKKPFRSFRFGTERP